jgi:hypothetical protein
MIPFFALLAPDHELPNIWLEAGGIMTVFGGKGEGKVHPSRHIFII